MIHFYSIRCHADRSFILFPSLRRRCPRFTATRRRPIQSLPARIDPTENRAISRSKIPGEFRIKLAHRCMLTSPMRGNAATCSVPDLASSSFAIYTERNLGSPINTENTIPPDACVSLPRCFFPLYVLFCFESKFARRAACYSSRGNIWCNFFRY